MPRFGGRADLRRRTCFLLSVFSFFAAFRPMIFWPVIFCLVTFVGCLFVWRLLFDDYLCGVSCLVIFAWRFLSGAFCLIFFACCPTQQTYEQNKTTANGPRNKRTNRTKWSKQQMYQYSKCATRYYTALRCTTTYYNVLRYTTMYYNVLRCSTMCYKVLPRSTTYCSVVQCPTSISHGNNVK